MIRLTVALQRLPHADGLPLPAYASAMAAGADLLAAVTEPVILSPGARIKVPTGIAIALPEGFEAQVRPRSGLAAEHGVTVLNSPGTVDADYRGEIEVVLVNHGKTAFRLERGMRIAQLVVAPVATVSWQETAELPPSGRSAAGFGSTGLTSSDTAATGG